MVVRIIKALSATRIAEALGFSPADVAVSPRIIASDATPVTAPANDTNENTLATITIPANLLGLKGKLRITTTWSYTNSANNKIPRVRFGGLSGTVYLSSLLTTTAVSQIMTIFGNAGATDSQRGLNFNPGLGGSSIAAVTSSVDTTAETTVVITGQKATGSETLTLEGYIVEFIPGV